jgi:hypothetical protein
MTLAYLPDQVFDHIVNAVPRISGGETAAKDGNIGGNLDGYH